MGRREVLPLQQHVGQLRADGLDEAVDELGVGVLVDAVVAPAQVEGVLEERGVVGAHVEQDRQGAGGVDAADQRVERELADRDAHAADALVADAEDALAVGDDDDVDLLLGPVAQRLPQELAVRPGQVEAAGTPPDLGEAPAALGHRRRVDERECLRDVRGEQRVEEALVAVLQRAQVDVAVEVAREPLDLRPAPTDLFLEGLHPGREQPEQATLPPFLRAERGALRVVGVRQQSPSSFHDAHPGRCDAMRGRACPRGARDRRPHG